jgi:hypothetical protein
MEIAEPKVYILSSERALRPSAPSYPVCPALSARFFLRIYHVCLTVALLHKLEDSTQEEMRRAFPCILLIVVVDRQSERLIGRAALQFSANLASHLFVLTKSIFMWALDLHQFLKEHRVLRISTSVSSLDT